ncbi:hypothetical protein [Chondromyces crocatus]|uniref:Uncharacterized protein n=1 Tax=Chondromyces crocatus TaxID=52 RepID=A0A0K1ECQ0_CHOCO|nr:hypothetical protein [Chondromyces crocatus]AKT38614.1 uncharacterized protein CMC5_027610 [Chondromyces crocatus]
MLVECRFCGAPLDVSGTTPLVKCRYCEKTSQLRSLRTMVPRTPPNWTPPPQWTPPPHLHFPTTKPLAYHHDFVRMQYVVVLGVMLLALVVGLLSSGGTSKKRPHRGVKRETILSTPMRGGCVVAEASTHVSPDAKGEIHVEVDDDLVPRMTFQCSPEKVEPLQRISIHLRDARKHDARIQTRLRALFGRRFLQSSLSWEGASVQWLPELGLLTVDVKRTLDDGSENPHRVQQIEALWGLAKELAFQAPATLDPQTVRDYLGGGYALSALATLDPKTPVERSVSTLSARFRGLHTRTLGDLHGFVEEEQRLAIDHPWFGLATLRWDGRPGSPLKTISLFPPTLLQGVYVQRGAIDCLTRLLGPPEAPSSRKSFSGQGAVFTWPGEGNYSVAALETSLVIDARAASSAGFQRILNGLSACGQPVR